MSDAIKMEISMAVTTGFTRARGRPTGIDEPLLAAIEEEVLRAPNLIIGYLGNLSGVLAEVAAERARQDEMHGGELHDDTLTSDEWLELIDSYAARAGVARTALVGDSYRRQLVKVAALAVAAIQSSDRWEPF